MRFILNLYCFLILIVYILASGPPVLSFEKVIISTLEANYSIVSLDTVAKQLYGYKSISICRLYEIYYTNTTDEKTVRVGPQSNYMTCKISPKIGPFGYFCIDTSSFDLKTTTNFKPMYPKESFRITIQFIGITQDGYKSSDMYQLYINIKPPCIEQGIVYKKLSQCKPSLKTLIKTKASVDTAFTFIIPASDKDKHIMFESITFIKQSITFPIKLEILDDNNDRLYFKSIDMSSNNNVTIATRLNKNSKSYTVKLLSFGTQYLILPNMVLYYYVMEEFCGVESCISKYSYWKFICDRITNKICIKDNDNLKTKFESCYRKYLLCCFIKGT